MHPNKKEIIICLLAFLALGIAASFFYRTWKEDKGVVQVNVYDLIASDPYAILVVNRPALLSHMLQEKKALDDLFRNEIPASLLAFLQQNAELPSVFSFHPQGSVLYVKANSSRLYALEKNLLSSLDHGYTPRKQKKYGIDFYYYPDVENRFLGYYEHEGVWVVSYSRKLLEEVALQQVTGETSLPNEPYMLRKTIDPNSPLNILFKVDPLDLYVNLNDSTEWRIQDKWLAADLFFNEGNICSHGGYPYYAALDTMYGAMADTLSQRLRILFPPLQPVFEINKEEDRVYYTGCSPLSGH